MTRLIAVLIAASVSFATAALASEPCDPSGTDAEVLASSRQAVDTACPCDTAESFGAYRRCAKETISGLVESFALRRSCRRHALKYATLSTCGRDGAAVCCRVSSEGRERHRVTPAAEDCADTSSYTTCISLWSSVVTGCDAGGCIAPVCGNDVVEPSEECDPPGTLACDDACQDFFCDTSPIDCGNLVLDAGEACEPPGAGSCGIDCQFAPCAAAGPGEIEVACVEGSTSIGAGATSSGYLLAWRGDHRRKSEILARRFHGDGVAADAALTVVSEEMPCASRSSSPSVGSDGTGYYVVWTAYGEEPGFGGAYNNTVSGRRLGGSSGTEATDTIVHFVPVGVCHLNVGGPTTALGAGPSLFGAAYLGTISCVGYQKPEGAFLDFSSTPIQTPEIIGFPLPTGLPGTGSSGPASAASLAGSTLWVSRAANCPASGPCAGFVAAAWSDGVSTGPLFSLSSSTVSDGRPSVAAGDSSLLVAWRQGATATSTEVRAVRVTRAGGRIDSDGGLLLASVPAGVTGGPSVAFDGSRWLVAWTESSVSGNDLRAVAVETDGSVVDVTPRLVASQVVAAEPALASTGDGDVLAAFLRDDAGHSAIRAVLVTP